MEIFLVHHPMGTKVAFPYSIDLIGQHSRGVCPFTKSLPFHKVIDPDVLIL